MSVTHLADHTLLLPAADRDLHLLLDLLQDLLTDLLMDLLVNLLDP